MLEEKNQLTLDLAIEYKKTYSNFVLKGNEILFNSLANLENSHFFSMFIFGPESVGKTHILRAACSSISFRSNSLYLANNDFLNLKTTDFSNLTKKKLIAIDDVNLLKKNKNQEEKLFALYNFFKDLNSTKLILSANCSPKNCGFILNDLVSRFYWGMVFQVKELTHSEKTNALAIYAKEKGIQISRENIIFLQKHSSTKMHDLIKLITDLDKISLGQKKKITLPFIKKTIENNKNFSTQNNSL